MAKLNLWLESPGSLPTNLTVDESISVAQLKTELTARSVLPRVGADGKLIDYEIFCPQNGTILQGDTAHISPLIRDGDHLILRAASTISILEATSEAMKQTPEVSTDKARLESIHNNGENALAGAFSVTGIEPFSLDFTAEYPVLAISIRHTYAGDARVRRSARWLGTNSLLSGGKSIYAKDAFFMMADKNNKFKWVSPSESSYYIPDLSNIYPAHNNRRMTRYSLDKDIGENKNMIYPVRPFSITGISMEGFTPNKEYPVLAIDTDQYVKENQEPDEADVQEQQPSSQSMAFFLVGDDNGEFAWIAEDECRLYPLKT